MIPIYSTSIDVEEPKSFLKLLLQQTIPIQTSVNLLTPVSTGKNSIKPFGGKVISASKVRFTRAKYFFMRWTPKFLVDIQIREKNVLLIFKPAIFTTLFLVYTAIFLIGVIFNLALGHTSELSFGFFLISVTALLVICEIRVYLKQLKQLAGHLAAEPT